jgi:hypothetical protein
VIQRTSIRWLVPVLLVATVACKQAPTDPHKRAAAWVGEQPVYVSEVEDYFESNLIADESAYGSEPEAMDAVKSRLLDALVEERMLYIEAERREIRVSDLEVKTYMDMAGADDDDDPDRHSRREVEARQRLMVQELQEQTILELEPPSDEEAAAYAAEHAERLLPAQPLELRALQLGSMTQAKRVYRDIRRKRITFNEAALVHDPSPGQALPLRMSWDSLPSDLREALKDLKPGQISEPQEMQGSVYLFRVGSWLKDPEDQDEELLRRARQELEALRRRAALENLIAAVKKRSGVRIETDNLPFVYIPEEQTDVEQH